MLFLPSIVAAFGSFTTWIAHWPRMYWESMQMASELQVSFLIFSLILMIAIEVDMPSQSAPDYGTNMDPWDEEELRNCLDPVFKNLPHNKVATIVSPIEF